MGIQDQTSPFKVSSSVLKSLPKCNRKPMERDESIRVAQQFCSRVLDVLEYINSFRSQTWGKGSQLGRNKGAAVASHCASQANAHITGAANL